MVSSPFSPSPLPVHLPVNVVVRQVCAGDFHVVAVSDVGALFTWGRDDVGQLGLRRDFGACWTRETVRNANRD